jgi:hypothetical protein
MRTRFAFGERSADLTQALHDVDARGAIRRNGSAHQSDETRDWLGYRDRGEGNL